ncbi:MAG: hypothetical protein ABI847_16005, partial [Anaerolineales bacterium]
GRALWHWDGQQWAAFQHARLDLNDIAMASPDLGWAVGGSWKSNDHLLLQWNGQQWVEQSISANSPIIHVRASAANGAWLLAFNSQTGQGSDELFRYRIGSAPTAMPSPTDGAQSTVTPVGVQSPTAILPPTAVSTRIPSTQFSMTATPTTFTLGPIDRPSLWEPVIIALSLVVAGGAVALLLRRRRKP